MRAALDPIGSRQTWLEGFPMLAPIVRRILPLALLAGLISEAAAAQLQGRFFLDKLQFPIGEPVFQNFALKNAGTAAVWGAGRSIPATGAVHGGRRPYRVCGRARGRRCRCGGVAAMRHGEHDAQLAVAHVAHLYSSSDLRTDSAGCASHPLAARSESSHAEIQAI